MSRLEDFSYQMVLTQKQETQNTKLPSKTKQEKQQQQHTHKRT